MIDAHLHCWCLATPGHEWPTAGEGAIHRDFGPRDVDAAIGALPVEAIVLIQSQPTDRDTDWLLDLAADEPRIAGVVGWVDLADPDAPARIAALSRRPKLRGLRPMLQSIDEDAWLLRPALAPAIRAMIAHGLRFDALVQPRHLPHLPTFARAWPDLPIVIDHGAKPFAARGEIDPWRAEIAALARAGLYCKLSGLRTEQAPGQPADLLAPYVTHLVSQFGPRLMWGSDWPVVMLVGDDYTTWHADAVRLATAAGADLDRLFDGAARDFYGIAQDAATNA